MDLNEIMTKRGLTPSEMTQKFTDWVKQEILKDSNACGIVITIYPKDLADNKNPPSLRTELKQYGVPII